MSCGKQTGGPSLGESDQKELEGSPEVFSQDGHGVMSFVFVSIFSSGVVLIGVRTHVVATTVCDGVCTHTLICCTHIFWCMYTARTLRTFLCVLHTCIAQGCLQCACRRLLVISLSPFSCVTRPCSCCSVTLTSRPFPTSTTSLTSLSTRSCRTSPTWKRRSNALRTRTRSLVTWPIPHTPQVMSPPSSTTSLLWTMTRRSSTVVPSKESMESMQSAVLSSRCQRKFDGTTFERLLFGLSENSVLMDEISEDTWNEELNKLFLVKTQLRENCTRLSTTWRSKIWSGEIQNMHYLSHSVSLNLKDYSYWEMFNVQINLSVREYTWVVNWRWRIVFTRIAT